MNLLQIDQLSIGYGEKILSSNISLTLKEGELVGLVGQNGVGKSTLIRTFCGLQKPLDGNIILDGKSLDAYKKNEIARKISLVLTGKPDTMNLSVIELIALGRYPYSGWLGVLKDEDKEKIDESISLLEINYLATKKLFELSDGQLQKVMIARAFAQDTPIIILDEPTSHLDLRNKIEVLHSLEKLALSGKSILISTHEIDLASQVCHTFWCMDFQQDLLVGTPKELIAKGQVQEYLHIDKKVLTKK